MAEGAPAQPGQQTPPVSGGNDGAVLVHDRFTVFPGRALPEFDSPNAPAFAAEDKRGNRPCFALVLPPDLPPRLNTIVAMKGQQFSAVLSLLDYAFIYWPPLQREIVLVIFERPFGGRFVSSLDETFQTMSDADYQKIVLKPLLQGLEELKGRGVVHRGIRLNNLFFMDAERTRLVFGECVSTPPAFDQPILYETIDSGMAQPEGRGAGGFPDDMYAFGVTLLHALIGRRPGAPLKGGELLRAKISLGSYTALAGDARFSLAMIEVLRGLIIDDPLLRWDIDGIKLWLAGRRLSPLLAKPEKRAQRPFRFGNTEVFSRRDLAYILSESWEQAAGPVMDGQVEVWLRRSLDEKTMAEAVANLVRAAAFPTANAEDASTDVVVSKVCMLLDPQGPIRYRGLRAFPDSLGLAMAVAVTRQKDVRAAADCILRELPEAWFGAQAVFDPIFFQMLGQIKTLRQHLRLPQPGYGVERCLYDANETLPCLSPLVQKEYVLEAEDLLPALDVAAKRVDAKSWPADRHIIAFVAARFNFDVDKQINALNSSQADTSALGLLSLLAVLQWRLGPEALYGLSGWLGGLVGPIIASYHNREARRRLEREVPKLVRKGSLPELYNLLDDVEERQKDLDGFAWAKAEYAGAEQEIQDLETDTPAREVQAQRIGQQTSAIVSVMIGLITICVLLAMQLW